MFTTCMDMDWIAIEPVHRKTVLGIHLSEERNMFVAVKKNNLFYRLSPSMVNMQFIHRWWSREATSIQLSTSKT
jgi:hypothetical protein